MSDRTFELPAKFTALNGSIQYYNVKIKGVDFTAAANQEKFLQFINVIELKAQPVITSVTYDSSTTKSTVQFCLEQAEVWEDAEKQVSGHSDDHAESIANLKAQLENVFSSGNVEVAVNDAI